MSLIFFHFFKRELPSFLEFTSYIFSFHSILCGPFVFYSEYKNFITGKDLFDNNGKEIKPEPNPYVNLEKITLSSCLSFNIFFFL